MEVSCYSMDLYCDNAGDEYACNAGLNDDPHDFQEFPHAYIGPTREYCKRNASKHGWLFKQNRQTICPKCSGKVTKYIRNK